MKELKQHLIWIFTQVSSKKRSSLKSIYGFTIVKIEVPQEIDTIEFLLLNEKNHPRTWEAPTLKFYIIMS